MSYVLGVDLGTTFTTAAIKRGDRLVIAELGNRAATPHRRARLVQSAEVGDAVGDVDHVAGVDATALAGQHDAGDLDRDLRAAPPPLGAAGRGLVRCSPGTTRRRRGGDRRTRRRAAVTSGAVDPCRGVVWAVLAADPSARVRPGLIVGGTDGRFYRPRGAVVYGAGIFSPTVDMADFGSRFHGNNERIDLDSLRLVTDFGGRIVRDFDDVAAS